MRLEFSTDEVQLLIREIVQEVLAAVDWPPGRIALDEAEAAQACGVGKHVLRDLRLAGQLKGRRLGRKVVYTREDLLQALRPRGEHTRRPAGSSRLPGRRDGS